MLYCQYIIWGHMGPLRGPGSKGSQGSKGSKGVVSPDGDEFYNSASRNGKPYNRAYGALEMHPYPRLRRYFPRRGKFSCRSAFELISTLKHSVAKTSPSGGGAVGRRGAFLLWRPCSGSPSRAKFVLSLHTKGPSYESPGRCSEVGLFSYGRSPVVWFSLLCCHKLKLMPLPSTHSAP